MPRYWVCERCGGYNLRDECETCGLIKEEGQAYEVVKTNSRIPLISNIDNDEDEDQEDTLLIGILDDLDDDDDMDLEEDE